MLSRKVVEGEQGFAVLDELVGGLWLLRLVALQKDIEGDDRLRSVWRHPDLVLRHLGLALQALGRSLSTLALLCTQQR